MSSRVAAARGSIAPAAVSAARSCVAGPQHPQRQAGAVWCHRRQHGVQPHREPAGTDAGQLAVHPGLRVVETATRGQCQPLRQSSHRGLVGEPNLAAPQAVSIVNPHRVGRGDQDVGSAVRAQQRFQDARTGQFGLQHPKIGQDLGVAEHPAGLGADRSRHHVGPQPSGADSAASRSRTRSISEPLTPPCRSAAGPERAARPAPGARPPRAAIAVANRSPPCSNCSASCGSAFIDASSGSPAISATSAARNPPGDGPRTTSPRLRIDRRQHRGDRRGGRARAHVAGADQRRPDRLRPARFGWHR